MFFRLLEASLSSNKVSSALVASFLKRLVRLALERSIGDRGVLLYVVSLVCSLIKKHPQCKALIHRSDITYEGNEDLFDPKETDPLKSRAIESSLWEIVSLQEHECIEVRQYARVLKSNFMKKKGSLPTEELLKLKQT